jgi:hypothetical protein
MRYYKLNDKKEVIPCSEEEGIQTWGLDRRVALTEDENYQISTVFLPVDHSFEESFVLVFETMVFPINSYSEEECERYSTWDEAIAGHERLCKKWLKQPTYLTMCTGKRMITLGE